MVPESAQRNTQKRLSEPEKRAVVAFFTTNGSISETAQHFGVHRNTVSTLVNSVRKHVQNSVLSGASAIASQISNDARAAIQASVTDRNDVHKAATTGLSWLKGTGELQPDGAGTVNVFLKVQDLPDDWNMRFIGPSTEE